MSGRTDAQRQVQVQLGQGYEVRQELAAAVASHVVAPMVFALPLLALLIWFGVGLGTAPLRRLAGEVSQRQPEHLAPLAFQEAPSEIQPVVQALNGLLVRLEQALSLERQFTADAAHELRTPLAGLRTQAQVAARARDEAERHRALSQVLEGVDRMTHLVQQLLTLARLEPDARRLDAQQLDGQGLAGQGPGGASTDLQLLAESVLGELAPQAIEKGIELELLEGPPRAVSGRPELLRVLIRNLADNAVRYTPAEGRVQLSLSREPASDGRSEGVVTLRVLDSGPGIPVEERERVFDRFYRGLGTGQSGSGLGLAIVKRIADLHHADVRLEEGLEGRGVGVVVRFPPAQV